ncbi:MAG TPA: hypothetical protein VNL77_23480 [Roseiflexaceae bacterium]|nr:hypothetical protein [Roseiflexaceae bacterium]
MINWHEINEAGRERHTARLQEAEEWRLARLAAGHRRANQQPGARRTGLRLLLASLAVRLRVLGGATAEG